MEQNPSQLLDMLPEDTSTQINSTNSTSLLSQSLIAKKKQALRLDRRTQHKKVVSKMNQTPSHLLNNTGSTMSHYQTLLAN